MAKIESPFDAAMRENARLQARLAIKDATMEPQRVHIRLLQEKNRRLQSLNAELLVACRAAVDCGMVPDERTCDEGAAVVPSDYATSLQVANQIRAAIAKAEVSDE